MPTDEQTAEVERRLAEVDALRRRVLNVIPHALRTPITTFRGLAAALPTASEEQIREAIAPALIRLAAQAEHLLDDMLLAAGYSTALPTQAQVAVVVSEVIDEVWAGVGGGGPLTVAGADEVAVLASPGTLFKMLVHLLDNAAKYGDTAAVEVTRSAGRVRIDVVTTAEVAGDPNVLREPFYRGESAVMRSAGLGVGLTVTEVLAVHEQGSLTLSIDGGRGLRCRLELREAGS